MADVRWSWISDRRWQRVWGSAVSVSSMGPTFGEELAARAEHASGSMMPEQIDRGCEGVRRAMKANADAQTCADKRNSYSYSAEAEGSGKSEALVNLL